MSAETWQIGMAPDAVSGERIVSAVVPRPAGELSAIRGAIRECWRTEQEEWDRRPETRHRHEIAPDRFSKQDRMAQNRSLGWPEYYDLLRAPRRRELAALAQEDLEPRAEIHLHPMASERYLLTLARHFEELAPRAALMREEMAARPEEFEPHRCFDLDLWADCPAPMLGDLARGVERGLASFICWVGTQGRSTQEFHRKNALGSFHLWSRRSLAVFSTWARDPWFCDVRGRDLCED